MPLDNVIGTSRKRDSVPVGSAPFQVGQFGETAAKEWGNNNLTASTYGCSEWSA